MGLQTPVGQALIAKYSASEVASMVGQVNESCLGPLTQLQCHQLSMHKICRGALRFYRIVNGVPPGIGPPRWRPNTSVRGWNQ